MRVFIVDPYADHLQQHVQQIRMLFLNNDWEVQKISPDQKTYHEDGIILIPDTGGLNGCVEYCLNERGLPPHVRPQDQAIEHFRLKMLLYYINKGMPVIGLGYSSYLTFAEVTGGKLIFAKDGLSRGVSKVKIADDEEGFICSAPNRLCAGLDATQPHAFGEELVVLAEKMLHNKPNKGGVSVPVPNPKPAIPGNLII